MMLEVNNKETVIWNNKLWFIASDICCSNPFGLYSVDIDNHVQLIQDSIGVANSGPNPFNVKRNYLTLLNNNLYFLGSGSLWRSDGTSSGTQRLTEPVYNLSHLTTVNNKLYFKGLDTMRADIWESDGTALGTHAIKAAIDNDPFKRIFGQSNLTSPIVFYKNAIYFTNKYDTAIGKELYKIELFPAAVDDVKREALSIYPNPAREEITIDVNGAAEFVVYDVYGKMVITTGNKNINISGLAPGVYIVEGELREWKRYGRFLKE
jgi:hypothetical protein